MGWLSTDYMILETFIGCDTRIDRPIVTACRWTAREQHPTLSAERLQIAAACLNYGQMVVNHVPTQKDVFGRAEFVAKGIIDGSDEMQFPAWTLDIKAPPGAPAELKDLRIVIWPCVDWGVKTMEEIGDQEFPVPCRKFTSTTKKHGESLYAENKWTPGYEMIFAPAAGLLALNDLSLHLDRTATVTLAKCVRAMNDYFRDSGADVGADRDAFRAALPMLADQ